MPVIYIYCRRRWRYLSSLLHSRRPISTGVFQNTQPSSNCQTNISLRHFLRAVMVYMGCVTMGVPHFLSDLSVWYQRPVLLHCCKTLLLSIFPLVHAHHVPRTSATLLVVFVYKCLHWKPGTFNRRTIAMAPSPSKGLTSKLLGGNRKLLGQRNLILVVVRFSSQGLIPKRQELVELSGVSKFN